MEGYKDGCDSGCGELAGIVRGADGDPEMSDNSFLPGIAAWAKAMGDHDTPFLNEIKKLPMRHERPIIGYTEDKRRFIHHIVRIGRRLEHRWARLVPVQVYDDDGNCRQYWERNRWEWVRSASFRSQSMAPQPIYDMDWVDPNPPPTKMIWGQAQPIRANEYPNAVYIDGRIAGIAVKDTAERDFNSFADGGWGYKDGRSVEQSGRGCDSAEWRD